jgi:hypothetical protein
MKKTENKQSDKVIALFSFLILIGFLGFTIYSMTYKNLKSKSYHATTNSCEANVNIEEEGAEKESIGAYHSTIQINTTSFDFSKKERSLISLTTLPKIIQFNFKLPLYLILNVIRL